MEQELSEGKKSNKKFIVIIVILIVIILVLVGYLVWDKVFLTSNKNSNYIENSTSINKEKRKEENKEVETTNNIFGFDSTKINNQSNNYDITVDLSGVNASWIENDNSIQLNFIGDLIKQNYGLSNNQLSTITLNNFSKKIKEIYDGGIGQDVTGNILLVLLEDGSVLYIPLYKAIQTNHFEAYLIDGLSNITKFYSSHKFLKGAEVGGSSTVLAQNMDGTIYDIEDFLPKNWN